MKSPHDNPHWKAVRLERDLERILDGKPVSSNSEVQYTRASNVYVLFLKLLFFKKLPIPRRIILNAVLHGLLIDLLGRFFKRTRQEKENKLGDDNYLQDDDDFPF